MLKSCLRCDYSLDGLDADHPCPECGLRRDVQSECWRASVGWSLIAELLWGVAVVFMTFRWSLQELAESVAWSISAFVAALACSALLLQRFVAARRQWDQGIFAAVTPEGLHVFMIGRPARFTKWEKIAKAHVPKQRGRPIVIVDYHSVMSYVTRVWISNVFADRADAERFADIVNEYALKADG